MWFRRLVAIAIIISFIGMNAVVIIGLTRPAPAPLKSDFVAPTNPIEEVPTVDLKADPTVIAAGTTSAISWTTTGSPTTCTASGAWKGDKTAFGAESTGRITASGNYTYTLECKNGAGTATTSVTVTAGNAVAPKSATTTSSTGAPKAAVYCGGRSPCYGKSEVASHSSQGNCWGWNLDRVINISGFDSAFHQARSGISSIQVSGVCGVDLTGALGGVVKAGSAPANNHTQATKGNSSSNVSPYFVGFYDAKKP